MSYDISTLDVSPGERFDYWTSVVCNRCIPADSHAGHAADFNARLTGRTLGSISVSMLQAPAHTWTREERHVRAASDHDIWVAYMETGSAAFVQDGRSVVQRPGDLVLYDSARPFTHTMSEQSLYVARIPRSLLAPRLSAVERLTATRFGEGVGVARILGEMIKESAVAPELNDKPGASGRVANCILDLLIATLDIQAGGIPHGKVSSHEAMYHRAVALIEEHLTDPELGVELLCQRLHVSPRTLTRSFAVQDSTVMRCILQKRLEASHRALIEGTVRNVTEAAMTYGFCDISHFSRSYKGLYGLSPQSSIRKLTT